MADYGQATLRINRAEENHNIDAELKLRDQLAALERRRVTVDETLKRDFRIFSPCQAPTQSRSKQRNAC